MVILIPELSLRNDGFLRKMTVLYKISLGGEEYVGV